MQLLLTPALAGDYRQWAVLGILLLVAAGFAVGNVVFSSIIGPKRKGKIKDAPYESGVDPIGTTHRRFNVRFYLVAMIFLVFDVEVLFFIPWITIFPKYAVLKQLDPSITLTLGTLFASVIVFTLVVLLAYVYAWAKGVFDWD
jgi:NADH-quinone oxidoreductase subunit A